MLEDVLVNLSVAEGRDPACDYAISVANTFNVHPGAIAYTAIPAIAGGCEISFRPRGGLWPIGRHRQLCVNTRARAIGRYRAAARQRGTRRRGHRHQ